MKESKLSSFMNGSIFRSIVLFLMGLALVIGKENLLTSQEVGGVLIGVAILSLIGDFWIAYRVKKSKKSGEITDPSHHQIASYLENNDIKYIYKPRDEKLLDFFLPQYDVYVKYWGKDFSEREKLIKYAKKKEIKLIEIFYDKLNPISLLHSSFMKKLSEQLKKK